MAAPFSSFRLLSSTNRSLLLDWLRSLLLDWLNKLKAILERVTQQLQTNQPSSHLSSNWPTPNRGGKLFHSFRTLSPKDSWTPAFWGPRVFFFFKLSVVLEISLVLTFYTLYCSCLFFFFNLQRKWLQSRPLDCIISIPPDCTTGSRRFKSPRQVTATPNALNFSR